MSSTEVYKATVAKACENYIKSEEKKYYKLRQEMILDEMSYYVWWKPGTVKRTEKEAVEFLDKNSWDVQWHFNNQRVHQAKNNVSALQHLADIANTYVTISADDAWIINKFKDYIDE